ncbi:MAG TPA: DNA primase, partial [Erysipelothrix sp.]|nr:DNA primase [Erysipelothrix sp.]
MARIPKELIDEIRNKSDIVETVSSYIPLQQKGKNFVGLCPFHEDNNPSLSVNPEKQIFKCFVCGTGGNVFGFIQEYEKIHFVEAVLKQAKNINIDVSQYETSFVSQTNPRQENLYELMHEVKRFTSYQLRSEEGQHALSILKERGYDDETLEKFGVGVALSNNQIFNFLQAKGYSEEEMLSVDMIRVGETSIQDVFYSRIMFPIHDQANHVVAFSARTTDPNSKVKYINTGDTEIYTKSQHIYNLNRVKDKFRHADQMILTEGVTDVFAFSMAGFDEAVSLLGVNISKTQLNLLKRNTKSVILAFDGDKAGFDATFEIGKKITQAGIPTKIWYNDSGLDPDDLYKSKGKEALEQGIENALDWLAFLIIYGQALYPSQSFEDKKRLVEFYLPHLDMQDHLTQEFYLKKLAELTEFDMSTLKSQLKTKSEIIVQPKARPVQQIQNKVKISRAELELLNQMILSKEAANIYATSLGFMPSQFAQEIALLIQNIYRSQDRLDIADLLSEDLDQSTKQFILNFDEYLMVDVYHRDIVYENIELIKLRLDKENRRQMLK